METAGVATNNWQIPPTVYITLTGIWLLGLLFGGVRLLLGHSYTTFFYRRNLESIPPDWQIIVDRLMEQINFGARVPRLRLSNRINSPALIGLIKPLILLPVSMVSQLTTAQVEAVLAHELSHLAHRDHWFNFIQSVIEVLFYFNPAVHWISHQVRDEREYRVDAHVAHLGIEPLLYAKTLFLLEEQRQIAPTIALAARPGSLLGRVQRLLQNTPNHYRMKPGLLLLLLLLVTTLFSFSKVDETLITTDTDLLSSEVIDHISPTDTDDDQARFRPHGSNVLNESIASREDLASMKFPNQIPAFSSRTPETEIAMLRDTTPPRVTSRQEIMTNNNGREIRIKKINDVVTHLEIDGKVIAKENYADYQELIDEHAQTRTPRAPRSPRQPMSPRAPRAPRSPAAPRAPRAPQPPGSEGETRTYQWQQRTETDGEEVENNSLFFQFFNDHEGGMKMAFPGMDSMMIVNPEGVEIPDFSNLLRGNGMTEEEQLELQEQLKEMTSNLFELRSFNEGDSFFNLDSMGSGFRMMFPGNGEDMEMEFDDEDVFRFHLDGGNLTRDLEAENERFFESDADLESLRDRNSSGLFGAGQGKVHRISSERFLSLVKSFQRRGLIKNEPIEKFSITPKKMRINGKKVEQSVMERYIREYADKYNVNWYDDLGDFDIEVNR